MASVRLFGVEQTSYLSTSATQPLMPESQASSDTQTPAAPADTVIPITTPPITTVSVVQPVPPPVQVAATPPQPAAVTPLFFQIMLALVPIGIGAAIGQRVSEDYEGILIGAAAGATVDLLAWAWVTYGPAPVHIPERPRRHDPWFRFTYSTPRGHIYNQRGEEVLSHASPPSSPMSSP